MRLVRRLVPQLGLMTVARLAWRHRGTVVRMGDLATRVPSLVRDGRTGDLGLEARSVLALDSAMPTDTSVRISGIDNGSVTLRGDPGGHALDVATTALCDLPNVSDVRTDGATHDVVDSVLSGPSAPA